MNKTYLIIGVLIFIVVILISVLFSTKQGVPSQLSPTPTIFPISITIVPSSTVKNLNPPEVPGSNQKLLDKMRNRKALSISDQEARNKVITNLGNTFELDTNTYSIFYLSAPNIFQVEIRGEDISSIKTVVVNWFKNLGLSNDGICNLPIQFYLTGAARQKAASDQTQFSPLPDGC